MVSGGVVASGCATGESAGPLPLRDAPALSAGGAAAVPDRWWEVFEDEGLRRSVERALSGNFTLETAWRRREASRALAEREGAGLYPRLDGVASAQRLSGDDIDEDSRWRVGLEAGYEVDLWGRIRSRVEAQRLLSEATRADYRAAALTVAAEVTRTWYRLVEARQQVSLIERQIETNASVAELLEQRFAAGQIRSADVLRQQQLVEATREQAVVARSRRALLENQLAVLQGRPPQAPTPPPDAPEALPEPPPLPATGLAGALVERRPDVRRARLRLEAADRELASAVSDQYPRIDLTGSLVTAAEDPGNLFNDWLGSIAGQLVAPLIDAGRRRAEVERASAVTRQRLAEYGQRVVEAFGEVEDALAAERFEVRRIARIERQLELARQTLEQLRTQYLNGVTDYVAVLTSLTQQQQLQRDLIASRLTRLDARISLYRALAGGFETHRERADAARADADAHTEESDDE